MATARQATGETDRRVLVGALLALGAVTGATFGRVFAGTAPAVRLAAAGALAVAVGALLVRRPLALSLVASAAGLILALGVLVFPRTTWAGLPTDDTIRSILLALERVGERAAKEVAPAPAFASLMTAGVIAVWAAGTAAHALGVRSRSAVLPLLPPAALLAFTGVVTEEGPRPGYVLAFLAVAFALLFAEALHRVTAWGPALQGVRRRAAGGGGARWARWLGVAAATTAMLLPGVLPGFRSGPVLRLHRPGARVAISPIVDIRPSLLRNPPANLFSVETDRASYWRMLTLDRFDGRIWTASDLYAEDGEEIQEPLDPLVGPQAPEDVVVEQSFEIDQLSTPWLPAAYRPAFAAISDLSSRWDEESAIIATDDQPDEGFRYRVTSRVPIASSFELNQRDPASVEVEDRYRALPDDMPLRIYGIARELTQNEPTSFRKLLAIQDYLRTFKYDERAPAGHGTDDMLFFLERSRRGYCEQFAGTMAVLARTLDYPSRVAVGFLPGDRDRTGRYQVTTDDVHAWTEIFFPDYGWLAFEPTPTRANPTAGYLAQVPGGVRPDANLAGAGGAAEQPGTGRGSSQRAFEPANPSATPTAPRVRPVERGFPTRTLILALLAVAALVALTIPPAKTAGRWLARARARTPRRKVLAAYGLLASGAADVGLGRRQGETLREYRARLGEQVAFSDGHLDRLTGITGRVLYSPRGVGATEAAEAVAAARIALRDVRRHAGALRVAAGAFRPPRRPVRRGPRP